MSEEHEILKRDFPVDFAAVGDGRTIDARIVPYGVAARVADPPDYRPYQESFVRGAFEKQTGAATVSGSTSSTSRASAASSATASSSQDREDGLYGSFRVHENADGDKALSLVRAGPAHRPVAGVRRAEVPRGGRRDAAAAGAHRQGGPVPRRQRCLPGRRGTGGTPGSAGGGTMRRRKNQRRSRQEEAAAPEEPEADEAQAAEVDARADAHRLRAAAHAGRHERSPGTAHPPASPTSSTRTPA